MYVPAEVFEDLYPLHRSALLVPSNGGHTVHKVLVRALRTSDAIGSLPGQHLGSCHKLEKKVVQDKLSCESNVSGDTRSSATIINIVRNFLCVANKRKAKKKKKK